MTSEARLDLESLCRIVNEAQRAYGFCVGDFSTPSWNVADQAYRKAALDFMQSYLMEPELTGERTHKLWKDSMSRLGWAWGIHCDSFWRTDPRMRGWQDLAPTEKVSFDLLAAIVVVFQRAGLAPEET